MVKAISTKALPDVRVDVIGRDQQAGGDGDAGGAEAEGDGVDVRDVDAGELGPELLLGDRADRLADIGPAHDQPEQQRDDEHRAEADHARNREKRETEVDGLERIGHVDGAGIGAEGVEQRVLDDDGDAERDQQHVAVIAVRGGADDEALQRIAEREECRRQQQGGEIGIEAESFDRRRTPRTSAAVSSAPCAKLMMCSTP